MEQAELSELRARVFISCGQNKKLDEVSIASDIAERLRALGFDPYVAVQEQTLRGLKENLFEQLSRSEYFIFVDFKREEFVNPANTHRGSLFCHQELAIASYLEIPVLAFQEDGVRTDDGILGFIQANAIPFRDRQSLSNLIADEVGKRNELWVPTWRNELVLERDPTQYSRTQFPDGRWCRFFHIGVRNRHRRKTARDCYAYLKGARRLDPGNTDVPIKQVEFPWAGYNQPNAHIFPRTLRSFDAFFILEDFPTKLGFNVFATGTDFIPRIRGESEFELEYSVLSGNFPDVKASFLLTLDASLERTKLVQMTV